MAVKSEWREQPGAERVNIAGSGKINGGIYQSISVSGSGTITGDVKAQSINIAGSCLVEGSLEAEELKSSGSCHIEGNVKTEEFHSSGMAVVQGDVISDVCKWSGRGEIFGRLSTSYTKISGSCKVEGSVEADKFNSEGSFEIGGLLTADEVLIRLGGECRAEEIGGEKIEVRQNVGKFDREKLQKRLRDKAKGKSWSFKNFGIEVNLNFEDMTKLIDQLGDSLGDFGLHVSGFVGKGSLEAHLIEGDEIYLESTKAHLVRGKRVTLGPDCEIEKVEYQESLEIDEQSRVNSRERV